MAIPLPPEWVALIEDKVARGGYRDANEMIGAAMELLDADIRRLRDAVEEALASGDPAEVDLESLKAHVKTGTSLRFLQVWRRRFLPASIADLGDIHAHVADHLPRRADALVDQLVDRARLLRTHPRAAQSRPEPGPRFRSLVEAPCLILYRLDQDEELIVRILHGARDIRRREVS